MDYAAKVALLIDKQSQADINFSTPPALAACPRRCGAAKTPAKVKNFS